MNRRSMVATAAAMDSQTYFFNDGAALTPTMLHEGAGPVEHRHLSRATRRSDGQEPTRMSEAQSF